MNKTLKHIKQHTYYIGAEAIIKAWLDKDKQLNCKYKLDRKIWTGSIQKIYNDKNGNAIGYDIYLY